MRIAYGHPSILVAQFRSCTRITAHCLSLLHATYERKDRIGCSRFWHLKSSTLPTPFFSRYSNGMVGMLFKKVLQKNMVCLRRNFTQSSQNTKNLWGSLP